MPTSAEGHGYAADPLTVGDALALPPLDQGRVIAGRAGLTDRLVRWVAVIEWPVEDFVAPGELVLTTGMGCTDSQFERLAGDVADAGAAALCVCVGTGAPLDRIPPATTALGERLGLPIVELPWAVRFADILRAVADRLMIARYAAAATNGGAMPAGLTAALLRRDGLEAVVEAAEAMLGRPALVLDAAFAPLTAGPLAATEIDLDDVAERATGLGPEVAVRLRERLGAAEIVIVPELAELALPVSLFCPVQAQGRLLGYVVTLGDERTPTADGLEAQALRHTSVAAAIELLRRRAAAEAESRVHGDFLWELAAGGLGRQELAAKATLLGYSLHERYDVLVARAEPGAAAEALETAIAQIHRLGSAHGVRVSRRAEQAIVLVPSDAPEHLRPVSVAGRALAESASFPISWGIADASVGLLELGDGVSRARGALRVGRALRGPGVVARADELELDLMLSGLAGDGQSNRAADALLEPLTSYDSRTSRELTRTLEVYLQENGNTSSAARRLFLNRHSMIYRLRRIEELTGRDLTNHEDRFTLEVSLRIRRLGSAVRAED